MSTALLVALGAAVGAPLRFVVSERLRDSGGTAHAGTLAVNVIGSFVLGVLVGVGATGDAWALVGIGFCGALTTMSTLALEMWDALMERHPERSLGTLVLHLLLGLGAAWLGWVLAP